MNSLLKQILSFAATVATSVIISVIVTLLIIYLWYRKIVSDFVKGFDTEYVSPFSHFQNDMKSTVTDAFNTLAGYTLPSESSPEQIRHGKSNTEQYPQIIASYASKSHSEQTIIFRKAFKLLPDSGLFVVNKETNEVVWIPNPHLIYSSIGGGGTPYSSGTPFANMTDDLTTDKYLRAMTIKGRGIWLDCYECREWSNYIDKWEKVKKKKFRASPEYEKERMELLNDLFEMYRNPEYSFGFSNALRRECVAYDINNSEDQLSESFEPIYKKDTSAVQFISATELYAEYKTDEKAANNKYKFKRLAVIGVVAEVGYGEYQHRNKVCVELITDKEFGVFNFIHCYFSNEIEKYKALRDLSEGEKVIIDGICTGLSFASVEIDICSFYRTDGILHEY
ncbi:MAG: OB-fold putative lipoprotein [Tannerella sp.]|jgi:hypothetical protein|nr:OB-fold putative lipoprotein [Tannerella sp.]